MTGTQVPLSELPQTHDSAARLSALRYAFSRRVITRNCCIALVVGCVLTTVNQFDVLFSEPFTLLLGMKIFANFLIPFVVSSTSAVVNHVSG